MILRLSHIRKSFGRKLILDDINLEVERGSLIGITGENGSGKSTLLKMIIGELKPNNGTIDYQAKFGYCPQESTLFSQLTVKENFKYFSIAYGLTQSQSDKKRQFLAEYFNFDKYMDDRVSTLSSGTKQKVNLSLALLNDPELLILDEPYVGFDWETYLRFWEYSKEVIKKGTTILIVAHLLTNQEEFDKIYQIKNKVLI
ncbi:MAG: ABC transporter ATP-binding protein [Bacteroidia bacterium]|nr:ABC transporter ATP-binding protein [Bacteroidia bacterium]